MNTKKIKKIVGLVLITILISLIGNYNRVFAADNMSVGTVHRYNLTNLTNSNNMYCVAHEKVLYSYQDVDFTVKSYVEIKGNKIVSASKNPSNSGAADNSSNAIMAAMLGGALTQGHGSYKDAYGDYNNGVGIHKYNAAQIAVWGYWHTWINDVGKYYGLTTVTNNAFDNASVGNYTADNYNKYLAQAKAAAEKSEYHVKIYFLDSGATNWQNVIYVETFDNTPPDEPQPGQTEVTGYVNINGYVWEDIANSKSNTINSKYEDGDLRVEGIKVHWKASNGQEIATATTDSNGAYKLTTTIALYNHPYGIKDKTKYDQINNSYVEFEYNGLKYTTVAYNGNITNSDTSKGKENETSRTNLDNKFDKVENSAVYDGNTAIITGLPNTKISDANYTPELAVSASTMNITRDLMKAAENNNWTEKKEFCIDHCQVGEGPHKVKVIKTSEGSTIEVYCNGNIKINDVNNEYLGDIIKGIKEVMGDEINTAPGSESHYYSAGEIDGPTHRDCRQGAQEIYVWNINNMNLGLTRREQPDAAISSDIEKVRVIMKNQEYTYEYGNRGIQSNEELFDYKVKFGNKYTQIYTRPVNPADIAYVNYNNTDDLKVYVTYNIILKNQSNTLPMTINGIVNYYDSDYTIYTGQGSSTSDGWKQTDGNNNGFKVAYNTNSVTLQPESQSELIKLEFEVSQNKIKELQNEDTGFTFTNYTEIFSFTTFYGENTICAERETAAAKGKVNQQYAGLDQDSTPGNAVPENESTYEDDTDRAPSFLLKKDANYKTMSGIVYEDSQTEESKKENERLGNGLKDGNEKGVENVRVELLNAETGETAYLYYKDANGANRKPAITYSDSNGDYSFGDGTTCGVVVDNYIVKYTYGNADKGTDGNGTTIGKTTIDGGKSFVNARNYKSTIVTDSNVKSVMTGESSSDKWHLTMNEGVDTSIAIDDLEERAKQEELKYSTYNNEYNMSAYSKKFAVQLEYTEGQTAKVDDNGGNFKHDWAVFDFGIIERPREDVVINKTISKIKVTLGNGQVLIEGDPRKDKLNYVKPLGLEERTTAKFAAIDATKALSIEMDQELVQGATLEVWYSITLTNNSEKDYEYTTNSNYYNYGTDKQGSPLGLADLVVDYMSSSMVCNVGDDFKTENAEGVNNKDWYRYDNGNATDAEYLKNNGYISYKLDGETDNKTYETLLENKDQSIMTNTFANVLPGETKTSVIYASKLLANQEENHLYENHVEIVQLNSKTGRTIKNVDDSRTQVAKEYQPGNYIPNLSAMEHQQDDDNVRITITPPTGITNYTTIYIISAVVGLIVITGGIILIKKRFIKK